MSMNENTIAETSSALDVGFSSIANRNGESSSRAESKSSGRRSSRSRSEKYWKESETPEDRPTQRDEVRNFSGSLGRRVRKSGGFLLESAFANGSPPGDADPRGKRKTQDGQLRVDKRRQVPSRLSGESSLRSSPLTREVSLDVANADGTDEQSRSSSQGMDPAQLVQMALNLSESRKRHVSNTLQVPLPSPRRSPSGPISNFGTVRASSSARKRTSRVSDDLSRSSPGSNRSGMDDQPDETVIPTDFAADNVLHTFTPATLSRAEKARKYFELASEYWRLLDRLPPLKPDSSAPGNYTFETASTPGSAYPEITRVPSSANEKHALGRQYNPIQSLRNRRVRIREKRPFPAPPDTWTDPEKVSSWIGDVETAAKDPFYRANENRAHLPTFAGDGDSNNAHNQEPAKGHRRTDTAGSVITRPENSWTIEPMELLADAYWTEKSDNKFYIETRRGNAIFPSQPRKSIDTPKISIEMHRDRGDEASFSNKSFDEEESGQLSRRRRLLMPLKGPAERRRARLMSRSSSTSSGSSAGGRLSRHATLNRDTADDNIGPLERHMQELIAKEANGELSSPEMTSPDHWKHLPYGRRSIDNSQRESLHRPNNRASLEVPREGHRRSKSADGRVGSMSQAMSSTEDLASEPASPVIQRHMPPIGMDLSPPSDSRRSIDGQGSRVKLPKFRSSSKERNKIGQMDFAEGSGNNLSPIISGQPRSSQESGRPFDFIKRHKTNDSYSSSLHRVDTSSTVGTISSTREPGSTVGRLFKGGRDRIEGLVRGDGPRFSDRFKARDRLDGGEASRAASDMSDLDDDTGMNGSLTKRLTDPPMGYDSTDVSPRGSFDQERSKQRYHLSNLPSFTSSARDKRLQMLTPLSTTGNPFDQSTKTQRESRDTESSDRLAPPGTKMRPGDSNPNRDVPFSFASVRYDVPHKDYGELAAFGAVPFGRRDAIVRSPGQRHWSIYDQAQPTQADTITSRDIARVRTLLLCSGIKAREIQRRGNIPRDSPSAELAKAAETSGQTIGRVPLKEEHLVAARFLSTHLNSALSNFEGTISQFQDETAKTLASQLEELQERASDHLTTLVHETSDEADAFTIELTTKQVHQTKRVDEAIDDMLRERRRQFQLLRKAGFKLLEWLVLGIMWWIWFMVVVFKTFKRMVVAVLMFSRWLFTF